MVFAGFSTNKADSHDITEILLKMALSNIKSTNRITAHYAENYHIYHVSYKKKENILRVHILVVRLSIIFPSVLNVVWNTPELEAISFNAVILTALPIATTMMILLSAFSKSASSFGSGGTRLFLPSVINITNSLLLAHGLPPPADIVKLFSLTSYKKSLKFSVWNILWR